MRSLPRSTDLVRHKKDVHVALEVIVCERMWDSPLLVVGHVLETLVAEWQTTIRAHDMRGMLAARYLLNILRATEADSIARCQFENSAPLPIFSSQLWSSGKRREALLSRCRSILLQEMLEIEVVLEDSVVPSLLHNPFEIPEAPIANLAHVGCATEAIVPSEV